MPQVREETIEVRGWAEDPWPVVVRSAEPAGTPTLWVHGVPTCGEDWLPFLSEIGGYAPDLPGFGASSKRGDGDFTLDGYVRFTGALADTLGLERFNLVVHDWGGAAVGWAAQHPERIAKLVVVNAVPLFPGYRWHRIARLWRTPVVGEVAMGLTIAPIARRLVPAPVAEIALRHFDQGTQRAILRLYRSGDPEALASYGPSLGAMGDVPTLVVWGQEDPYITPNFAARHAEALGGATVRLLPGAGHWPWLDDDDARSAIVDFLR